MRFSSAQEHRSATGHGEQKLGEVISCEGTRGLDQKLCLSRAGDATDGDGTDGMLEVACISVSSQPRDLLLLLFF